jgi:transitional endoplasmic reticulum ATPase
MIASQPEESLRLRVAEAERRDVGRALVRVDPADMKRLGCKTGDIVRLSGEADAIGKLMPCKQEDRGKGLAQIDGLLREMARCSIDSQVNVAPVVAAEAETLTLRALKIKPVDRDIEYLATLIDGLPVERGGLLRVTLFGNEALDFKVENATPDGPVVIGPNTQLRVEGGGQEQHQRVPTYEDVGGAGSQIQRIREMIELPLRFPEVFQRLGIDPPKGVLMFGPPGCGKTLIARTIAFETDAKFFTISGPEIIHKFYGESEAHLRKIFAEAAKQGPSIIFLDEIDAIAPRRENAAGDVERRVVAQLLALMDGLNRRENVIVIAATNLPNAIDPALRRPGRFDREIEIPIPDRKGRRQILEIHSRGMPLTESVDLDQLAGMTHGFVGADLAALCREAAMACLRGVMGEIDFSQRTIPYAQLAKLGVSMNDFLAGFKSIEPSAIREVFVEVPQVRWDDIGGLEDVKQSLREAVMWPLNFAKLFDKAGVRPPKGMLLTGPPGCGKTTLAKAVATESKVNFISVKASELLSKYIGDSEKAVRDIFKKARQAAPCIVFFDEIDGLCATRQTSSSDSGVSNRVLSQFLAELDGVEELSSVLVLAATNRPDFIDPAMRRFGRLEQTIEIGLPEHDSRMQILSVHLRNKPLASDIDLRAVADQTEGWSGADLASICSQAGRFAIRRAVQQAGLVRQTLGSPNLDSVDVEITADDVTRAIETQQHSKEASHAATAQRDG